MHVKHLQQDVRDSLKHTAVTKLKRTFLIGVKVNVKVTSVLSLVLFKIAKAPLVVYTYQEKKEEI